MILQQVSSWMEIVNLAKGVMMSELSTKMLMDVNPTTKSSTISNNL